MSNNMLFTTRVLPWFSLSPLFRIALPVLASVALLPRKLWCYLVHSAIALPSGIRSYFKL
eukprot:1071052-Pyramimonas_sp.AAC.2